MDGLGLDGPWPAHKQNPFLPIGKWEEQLKKEQNKSGFNKKNDFFKKKKIIWKFNFFLPFFLYII